MANPPEAPGADEFAIIARHFAPLATRPEARGLIDDIALLGASEALIVKADAIVEGVHFLPTDPLDLVARKALRVNVSDVASKGGRAWSYLLTLIWPDARAPEEIALLAEGLRRDQEEYGLALLGGDTTRTPGPLTLAITMLATPLGPAPARSGAQAGDDVWVSGTIGDAALGLDARRGGLGALSAEARAFLERRYLLPEPRVTLAPLVARVARGSCDVSDGLIADAGKMAAASGLALEIEAARIPLSPPAGAWCAADEGRIARLACAGDDYEILFTAPASARADIDAAARALGVAVTRIGAARAGSGAILVGANGPIDTPAGGYAHRLGAGA